MKIFPKYFQIYFHRDAFFILLLLIDLRNSGTLAQLALFGTNQAEVTENIARGMELLGPAISLDTMVEALVIGVGTLSGVQRLEILCSFAVLSVLVNYIVFMTFYPAVLSLILDLSRNGVDRIVANQEQTANGAVFLQTTKALNLEENKGNPVVQRVKIIMTTGLMIVHIYSRVVFSGSGYDDMDQILAPKIHTTANNRTQAGEFSSNIIRFVERFSFCLYFFFFIQMICKIYGKQRAFSSNGLPLTYIFFLD